MMTHAESPAIAVDDGADKKKSWHKAKVPALKAHTSDDEALGRIVLSGLEHLRANEACVLARTHEEGVHQMRVAVRRLRSVLALFRELIPVEQSTYLNGELKWLIGELGPARDWDVFLADVLAPVMDAIPGESTLPDVKEAARALRDQAYVRAEAAIGAQRYVGLVLLLGAWADGRRWREGSGVDWATAGHSLSPHPGQRSTIAVAGMVLDERYRDVRTAGEGFAHLNGEDRHRLRIQVKKLRYATEFFTTLYPRRKILPYLGSLKALQEILGLANDLEVARKLLKAVARTQSGKAKARLSFGAGVIIGWHSHTSGSRQIQVGKVWERFLARPPYWETQLAVPSEGPPLAAGSPAEGGPPMGNEQSVSGAEADVTVCPPQTPTEQAGTPTPEVLELEAPQTALRGPGALSRRNGQLAGDQSSYRMRT
jgi:CHAD domain-containing protein